MKHIHRVVAGSIEVARLMRVEGKSVLVHCSDGWDRTSQICAIAQLLLDPYVAVLKRILFFPNELSTPSINTHTVTFAPWRDLPCLFKKIGVRSDTNFTIV